MHPESVAADSGSAEVRYEKVTLANVRHKTIHAQLAMPVSGKSFPDYLSFNGRVSMGWIKPG